MFDTLLGKNQFLPGDPNDPQFLRGNQATLAYTRGTGEDATIVYDPGVDTPGTFRSGYDGWASFISTQTGISPEQAWALGFLHELSHATGKFVHEGDRPPFGDTIVIGGDELNQMIIDACFK